MGAACRSTVPVEAAPPDDRVLFAVATEVYVTGTSTCRAGEWPMGVAHSCLAP